MWIKLTLERQQRAQPVHSEQPSSTWPQLQLETSYVLSRPQIKTENELREFSTISPAHYKRCFGTGTWSGSTGLDYWTCIRRTDRSIYTRLHEREWWWYWWRWYLLYIIIIINQYCHHLYQSLSTHQPTIIAIGTPALPHLAQQPAHCSVYWMQRTTNQGTV